LNKRCFIYILLSILSTSLYSQHSCLLKEVTPEVCPATTYANLFEKDKKSLMIKARAYSDAGYFDSSLIINTPLRAHYPKDDYIIATQANALYKSGRPKEALAQVHYLKKNLPNSEELPTLYTNIEEPLQDNLSLGYRYTDLYAMDFPMFIPSGPQFVYQNDTVTITRIPVIAQKYFFDNNTNLLFKAQYEYYRANLGSGLETAFGQTHIHDWEYYLGLNRIIRPGMQLQAFIGELDISDNHQFMVYSATANLVLNEVFLLSLEVFHDLFRPLDIYNGSPLLISLGILETTGRTHLNYKADLKTTLDLDVRYGSLSDGNAYTRTMFGPSRIVYNNDTMTLSFNLDLEWLTFINDRSTHGYYSPLLYQLYQIGAALDFNPTDDWVTQFYGAWGAVKDNFTPNFGLSGYMVAQAKYKLRKNLKLGGGVSYTYEQLKPSYQEVDVAVGVNWNLD
jgi:hypothetical protein